MKELHTKISRKKFPDLLCVKNSDYSDWWQKASTKSIMGHGTSSLGVELLKKTMPVTRLSIFESYWFEVCCPLKVLLALERAVWNSLHFMELWYISIYKCLELKNVYWKTNKKIRNLKSGLFLCFLFIKIEMIVACRATISPISILATYNTNWPIPFTNRYIKCLTIMY